jgi:hypothetical protein
MKKNQEIMKSAFFFNFFHHFSIGSKDMFFFYQTFLFYKRKIYLNKNVKNNKKDCMCFYCLKYTMLKKNFKKFKHVGKKTFSNINRFYNKFNQNYKRLFFILLNIKTYLHFLSKKIDLFRFKRILKINL